MTSRFEGKVIFFATDNIHKFNEARKTLGQLEISVGMLRVKTMEIQSDSLWEIAKSSAAEALRNCSLPIIVEDAGLFIKSLKGFPGPYAAYAYKTIGNVGLLKLMENNEDREARFMSVVAYCSSELRTPKCFTGEAPGIITKEEGCGDGKSGFGFDPIFKPATASKTFAEMTLEEKNRHSHRADAIRKFGEWYADLIH